MICAVDASRIEVGLIGDIEVVTDKPKRLGLRRRKLPSKWTDNEIRDTFVTAYLGTTSVEGHTVNTAAIVCHVPPELVPRKLVRYQEKNHGEWRQWEAWCICWDEYLWSCVQMGDEPYDLIKGYCPCLTEEEARMDAREMADQGVRDVGYFDLPVQARQTLGYAVRHGPGYFFDE